MQQQHIVMKLEAHLFPKVNSEIRLVIDHVKPLPLKAKKEKANVGQDNLNMARVTLPGGESH